MVNSNVTITQPIAETAVCKGATVACKASASDSDHYVRGGVGGDEADTISTYTWSATGGTFPGGATGDSVTWQAPSEPGQYTITCTADDTPTAVVLPDTGNRDDSSVQKDVTVKVIGGDYTADKTELRYYCGASVPEQYMANLTAASGQPSGTTYSWQVISGPATIYYGQSSNSCVVRATEGSSSRDDIIVTLTYMNSGCSCQYTSINFTSLKPTSINGPLYSDYDFYNGYATEARYYIRDQFGYTMYDFTGGETFENDRVNDWQGNDWPCPEAGGSNFPTYFADTMAAAGEMNNPTPQNTNGAGDAVFHHTQHLWVGSSACDGSGCLLKTHSQKFYRNRGRHE